jgi:hypothetical protein
MLDLRLFVFREFMLFSLWLTHRRFGDAVVRSHTVNVVHVGLLRRVLDEFLSDQPVYHEFGRRAAHGQPDREVSSATRVWLQNPPCGRVPDPPYVGDLVVDVSTDGPPALIDNSLGFHVYYHVGKKTLNRIRLKYKIINLFV